MSTPTETAHVDTFRHIEALQAENAELRDANDGLDRDLAHAEALMEVAHAEAASLRERLEAAELERDDWRIKFGTALLTTVSIDDANAFRALATAAERDAKEWQACQQETRLALESAVANWNAAEGERDRLREALIAIRDRYVKHLPGIEKPRCTLCGADEGSTHSTEFNCGQAGAFLAATPHAEGEASAPPKETTP